MGVSSEHILLYGWRVPYDKVESWDYEQREQWYYDDVSTGEVALVFDGRSGEYALVGILQFCSDDRRWSVADIPLQTVTEPSREAERELYRAVYQEMDLDPDGEPDHHILTHHT